jgi:hypothetical protein
MSLGILYHRSSHKYINSIRYSLIKMDVFLAYTSSIEIDTAIKICKIRHYNQVILKVDSKTAFHDV